MKKIIQQKKVISEEEYKKKVEEFKKKSFKFTKRERNKLLSDVSKQRAKAKMSYLKILNPIIENYMKEKK